MRRNAENIHLNIAYRVIHLLQARLWSIQKVLAVRHAWPATQTAAIRRSTELSAALNPVFQQGRSPAASRLSTDDSGVPPTNHACPPWLQPVPVGQVWLS